MDIRLDAPPVDPTDFPLTWCLKQMSACGSYSQQKNKLTTKPIKKLVAELFENWKNEQMITYYNENLENEFPEFKHIMDEYRDGLLLFDLMEKEIWNKSKSDNGRDEI